MNTSVTAVGPVEGNYLTDKMTEGPTDETVDETAREEIELKENTFKDAVEKVQILNKIVAAEERPMEPARNFSVRNHFLNEMNQQFLVDIQNSLVTSSFSAHVNKDSEKEGKTENYKKKSVEDAGENVLRLCFNYILTTIKNYRQEDIESLFILLFVLSFLFLVSLQ